MLIWTRPSDTISQDQKLFPQADSVLFVPCIKKTRLLVECKELATPFNLFITSPYAAECYLKSPFVRQEPLMVYCFGKKTFEILSEGKIPTQFLEVNTAEKACEVMLDKLDPSNPIYFPGPKKRAFDCKKFFTEKGFIAENLSLYKTETVVTDDLNLKQEIKSLATAVAFSSPSAVAGFIANFPTLTQITAVTIGPTTASAAAKHFPKVQEAKDNNLQELANLGILAI